MGLKKGVYDWIWVFAGIIVVSIFIVIFVEYSHKTSAISEENLAQVALETIVLKANVLCEATPSSYTSIVKVEVPTTINNIYAMRSDGRIIVFDNVYSGEVICINLTSGPICEEVDCSVNLISLNFSQTLLPYIRKEKDSVKLAVKISKSDFNSVTIQIINIEIW